MQWGDVLFTRFSGRYSVEYFFASLSLLLLVSNGLVLMRLPTSSQPNRNTEYLP